MNTLPLLIMLMVHHTIPGGFDSIPLVFMPSIETCRQTAELNNSAIKMVDKMVDRPNAMWYSCLGGKQ
jgi:hypothetical protein